MGLTATAGAPPASQDADTCFPACHAKRGVCNDGICFCRSPWYGPTCGREMQQGALRMSYLFCIGASVLAALGGLLLGSLAHRTGQHAKRQLDPFGEDAGETKKEVWMPAGEKKTAMMLGTVPSTASSRSLKVKPRFASSSVNASLAPGLVSSRDSPSDAKKDFPLSKL